MRYGTKYHSVKTTIDGIKFDSKKEARRYEQLIELMNDGVIRDLKLQPHFTLQEAFKTIDGESVKSIVYVADFSYRMRSMDAGGEEYWPLVVEDVKGVKTDVYQLKRKMMIEKFGIIVKEV